MELLFCFRVSALLAVAYFTASKWAIRHETITFHDAQRNNRPVPVYIAVRRDKVIQADAGMIRLPVAVLNHGNTVQFTEYSFLQNVFAARGYLAISIQHDLPTDPPMVTKVGRALCRATAADPARRRQHQVRRQADEEGPAQCGLRPSHGGRTFHGRRCHDVFRQAVSGAYQEFVTLDNLRVPFVTTGKFKITFVSFARSAVFKTDPGVIPSDDICKKDGITIVKTDFQHNDMRDTGAEEAKEKIQDVLEKFLSKTDTDDADIAPIEAERSSARSAGSRSGADVRAGRQGVRALRACGN